MAFLYNPLTVHKLALSKTGDSNSFTLSLQMEQMEQMTDQLEDWLAIMATHFENPILS